MKKTLELLKSKWKQERNYTFICDQFKSLRQDLTVQRVKSEFTVQVYETHGRIALEKADLGEYNQCQTQLKQLYNIHKLPGKTDEFVGYRILYLIHTRNKRGIQTFYIDLMKQMEELEVHPEGDAVEHALAVRASLAQGNYHRFFQLYHTAPNLSGYLMDLFLERERLSTLQKLCKAYRPSLPLEFVIDTCGFYPADVSNPHEKKKILADGKRWLSSVGVVTDGVDLDCKASSQGIAAKVQFSSQGVDIKGQIH